MPIRNIIICRACLAKCKEDKVLFFESFKDIFTELTSLQLQETTELPKYLCKECGKLLNLFKNFKETCIESDTHLRKAASNTTPPLRPFELIKIECPSDEAEEKTPEASTLPLKRKRKPTKKQEALNAQRLSLSKRKVSEEHNVESVEENVQLEKSTTTEETNEDERPNDKTKDSFSEDEEPSPPKTSKKRPSSKSDSKTPVKRPYESSKSNCLNLKNNDGIDGSTTTKADEEEIKLIEPSKKGTNEEQTVEKVNENKAFEKSSKIKQSDEDETEDSFSEDDDKLFEPPKSTKQSQSNSKSKTRVSRPYNCSRPKCKKSFSDELRLHFHLRKHDGFDPTICDICEKPLASLAFMLRHRLSHRSLEERSQTCKVCNKILLSDRTLEQHMKIHQANKSFICDVCGVGCLSGGALKIHKQIHDPDSVYQCKQCPKSYGTYARLYEHVKHKHGRQLSVACNICGTVMNKKRLYGHCKNQHTVFTTTENIFQCKFCDVKCKTADNLKHHEKLHTGIRKYQCPLCPKAFAHSGLLKKHGYFHSGERPVHCDECGKGFYQKCALDIHMNVHKKQWIAQGVQGITLTKYKQSKKVKAKDLGPDSSDDT